MNKKSLYIQLLLKLGTIVLITVLTLEIIFRVYNKFIPVFIFNNSYNRFRGKPFTKDYNFRLNSKGFKDIEHGIDKKANIFRIIVIGDSFVYGAVPYEYNFTTLLSKKLNQEKEQFEIINMGIPCIGVDSYFALLINEGLSLNPDLVICCFFVGNDFTDYVEHEACSYLYIFLKYLFKIYPSYKENIMQGVDTYHDDLQTLTLQKFIEIEKERGFIFVKDVRNNGDFSQRLDWVSLYLKRMKNVCSSRHVKFLVVVIPDEMQVNSHLQEEVIKTFKGVDSKNFDFELPNRMLRTKLGRLDIIYLDLFNDFLILSKNKRYYKLNDTHWNIAGNELASGLIHNKIMQLVGR